MCLCTCRPVYVSLCACIHLAVCVYRAARHHCVTDPHWPAATPITYHWDHYIYPTAVSAASPLSAPALVRSQAWRCGSGRQRKSQHGFFFVVVVGLGDSVWLFSFFWCCGLGCFWLVFCCCLVVLLEGIVCCCLVVFL